MIKNIGFLRGARREILIAAHPYLPSKEELDGL